MSHENEIGLELMNSLLTSGIAMLVAAASDLLPNVRSKSHLLETADKRSEKRQTNIPPFLNADRNRYFYHLRMSL
jgi:hypothetical protein